MNFYSDKELSALVLVNPDNPSGNYIKKEDVQKLAQFCKDRNTLLILDESFLDFSDTEEEPSFMTPEILNANQNLV